MMGIYTYFMYTGGTINWIKTVKENLVEKSNALVFSEAILEWKYVNAYVEEERGKNCDLCNHQHIRNIHVIKNKSNDNRMEIGSECIKKFTRKFEIKDEEGNEIKEREVNIKTKKSNR